MSEIRATIKSVKDLISVKDTIEDGKEMMLSIPHYQRPYRWNTKNVRQLLEDILTNRSAGKERYRIGSVILYKNCEESTLDIVDGQQRITTLLLLAKAMEEQDNSFTALLDKLEYKHNDSRYNIVHNYKYITEWIGEHTSLTADFWHYIKEKCEFVVIVVNDLSEAFQMFDSQNGRGKELEAYNLLKAYHIRAMDQDTHEQKVACDKRWEAATMYDATPSDSSDPNIDVLKQIFDEQLYRGRMWSKGHVAHKFTKADIDEFKGFTIDKNHNILFPFQNPSLLHYLTEKFYRNILAGTMATQPRFNYGDSENIDPFVSITQQIVNGKSFFDYVETYVEIYKQLFIQLKSFQLREFKEFFYTYCLNYDKELKECNSELYFKPEGYADRSGDTYLREAYKTVVMLLFDKFGENGLNKYYKVLYKLIYCERVVSSQVRRDGVAKLPLPIIAVINQAQNLADLIELESMWTVRLKSAKENNKDNGTKGIDIIKRFVLEDKEKER